jgi:hypothetical protein
MTDTEKIVKIKQILKPVLDWYFEKLEEEKRGEIDSSYIYDTLWEQLSGIRRGDILTLIETIELEKGNNERN